MNKQETEEQIGEDWYYKQYDYFESCVDRIYQFFQTYGYTWSEETNPPTRNQIIKDIMQKIGHLCSDLSKSQVISSGRITVSRGVGDTFEVSISL